MKLEDIKIGMKVKMKYIKTIDSYFIVVNLNITSNKNSKIIIAPVDCIDYKLWVSPEHIEPYIEKLPEKLTIKSDVNHPSHYNTGKIEVIDFIEDQKLDFNLGNVVKYITRAGKKDSNTIKEDLEKAAWYLNRSINSLP